MRSTSKSRQTPAPPITAKLFQNGRSQAVRLPKEFRFEGKEVRIRRTRTGVLLEPIDTAADREALGRQIDAWFAKLDSYNAGEVFPEGRNQPPIPVRDWFE